MEELSSLLARVERLERDNRRWRRAGALLSVALLGLMAASFAGPDSEPAAKQDGVLRGEALELAADGETYARIFMNGGSPMLLLKKGEEKSHVVLTLNKPALHIRDEDGSRGAFVGFDSRGLGKVELNGTNLVDGVRMSLKPDGTAGVYALDSEGYDRAVLEHTSDGNSSLSVRASQGKVRGSLGLDENGNTSMILLDAAGRRRIGTVVFENGTPFLSLEDENQQARANLSMGFDGSPTLEFFRADGGVVQKLP